MSKLISIGKIWLETQKSITMKSHGFIQQMKELYGGELDIVVNVANVVSNAPLWNG